MSKKYDVRKHILVPKHIKVSKKEADEVLQKYNISSKELPKIRKDDPAVKHLSPVIGDIIKIVRKSKTAGESIFYRGVSNE